jgi:predicted nucleotidyltransferase component of viral defense system
MTSVPGLPLLISPEVLADLARESAAAARVQPSALEKDYYLTRLIWGLAQLLGPGALLKGGTLLSKVDLGFRRMSEDVDLVVPGTPEPNRRANAIRLNAVRDALRTVAPAAGLKLPFPHGDRTDRDAHVQWRLTYESEFGAQSILVEVSIRPVLLPPRRARLQQVLTAEIVTEAYCWALDELEARAEKVRAAYTRRAMRDYYDLQALADAGKDLTSREFITMVDQKLAELGAARVAEQPSAFGIPDTDRARLARRARDELATVVRIDEPPFDLDAMIARFDALWDKT